MNNLKEECNESLSNSWMLWLFFHIHTSDITSLYLWKVSFVCCLSYSKDRV